MYQGFVQEAVVVEETQVALNRAGSGPAVLLLHGYPETRVAWHRVAPELAARFSVVVPDLPGYGDSSEPRASPIEPFSKRNVARILVSLMRTLGHERFAVAGHDRGGRVAYRMALDNPEAVVRLALLDVVSTLDMAERLTYEMAWQMGNWFFLSQPAPVPETLIGGAPGFYLDKILDRWLGTPNALTPKPAKNTAAAFESQK